MMSEYKDDEIKKIVTDALDKEGIKYKEVAIEMDPKKYHHQGCSITVRTMPNKEASYERVYRISFVDPQTGCGLMIMRGFYMFMQTTVMDSVVEAMIQHYIKDGAGTIMATMGGGDHFEKNPFLLRMGFHPVVTYDNLAHSYCNDRQAIFLRSAPRREDDYHYDWEKQKNLVAKKKEVAIEKKL